MPPCPPAVPDGDDQGERRAPAPRERLDLSDPRDLRWQSTVNLLQMGHCAPTVMQTLLDADGSEAPWLVKLAAGLPGGIGNTGAECGGVTASLVMLGLRHGLKADEADEAGLPVVIARGRDLMRRFEQQEGSVACQEIRADHRLPLRCIGVVREAPALCQQSRCTDCSGALTGEERRLYARVLADWAARDFHCARSVLRHLEGTVTLDAERLDAVSAFLGGTVFTGRTCSALTAGVMALGLAIGEIEHSRLRVLRMVATMAVGGDALADRMNAFNRTMNLGHELSRWFATRFGSTQCHDIERCDFADAGDVARYLDGGGTARCIGLARQVAAQVQQMLAAQPSVG